LDDVERVFTRADFHVPAAVGNRARARAHALLEASNSDREAALAMLAFAVDLLSAFAVDLAARPTDCAALLDELERVCGAPRSILGRGVLRSPGLLQLPGAIAVEVELGLLLTLTKARAISLWTLRRPSAELKHLAHTGEFDLHALQSRRLARKLLSGDEYGLCSEGSAVGVIVNHDPSEPVALIARGAELDAVSLSMLEAAIPILTATLVRGTYQTGDGQSPAASAERQLAQLRFDLHDGPQQDVIMLVEDLRLFRTELGSVVEDQDVKRRLFGRVDDLLLRLVGLDGDLRRIGGSPPAQFPQADPLIDALVNLTGNFAARSGIEPETALEGDLTNLMDSELSTLVALLREALANIRKHSRAKHVTILVCGEADAIKVKVTDDGRGFDPERALIRAAREGHIGLASVYERVRLAGGRTQIVSRPGGPTIISAIIPRLREGRKPSRKRAASLVPRVVEDSPMREVAAG
jgi:signal transduction histidine kinase